MSADAAVPTALLVGTLDTKGAEYEFVRARLRAAGLEALLLDVGVLGDPAVVPDISSMEVAEAAGTDLGALRFTREGSDTRAVALETMQRGATTIVTRLVDEGRVHAVFGMGGSGGSQLISGVMRALPFGMPKLLLSTMASGDVSGYVGASDLALMHSVTDIAGLNRISRPILENAAGALAGMVAASRSRSVAAMRPAVGVSLLGVTTAGATRVARGLEAAGFDAVVFHAVGSGGRAMEALVQDGVLSAVVDFTIKEVTDETIGGIFDAGPERLRCPSDHGAPRVVVPGAVEVINFGALDTVPQAFRSDSRPLVQHNAHVTAVRATSDELRRVARVVAQRLNESSGAVSVLVPHGGFDSYATADGPFADPAGDAAFVEELKASLRPDIEVEDLDEDINDEAFTARVLEVALELFGGPQSTGRPSEADASPQREEST